MSKLFTTILITTIAVLLTACATSSDVTIVQVEIDGLTNQLDRTKVLVQSAAIESEKALAAAEKAVVSATKAEQLSKETNDRVNVLAAQK